MLQDGQQGNIAVHILFGLRKRGAGREIINKVLEYVKAEVLTELNLFPKKKWQHIFIFPTVQNKLA